MGCKNPITVTQNAKGLLYSRDAARFGVRAFRFPCGHCRNCRLRNRLDWSTRLLLESAEHDEVSVVTLTYRPEDRPESGSLCPADVRAFLKRLRLNVDRVSPGRRIRFFAVGEYGAKGPGHHPHYHILVFGWNFPDREFIKFSKSRNRFSRSRRKLFRSALVDRTWRKGHAWVDPEIVGSAVDYVAGYVMKKIAGALAPDHYGPCEREFLRCSNRPGIGRGYFERHWRDIYGDGYIDVAGRRRRIPRKFDEWLRDTQPEVARRVMEFRKFEKFQEVI